MRVPARGPQQVLERNVGALHRWNARIAPVTSVITHVGARTWFSPALRTEGQPVAGRWVGSRNTCGVTRQPVREPAGYPIRQGLRVVRTDAVAESQPGSDHEVVWTQVHGEQLDEFVDPGTASISALMICCRDSSAARPISSSLLSAPSRIATTTSSACSGATQLSWRLSFKHAWKSPAGGGGATAGWRGIGAGECGLCRERIRPVCG
jgi:hypothetical protein